MKARDFLISSVQQQHRCHERPLLTVPLTSLTNWDKQSRAQWLWPPWDIILHTTLLLYSFCELLNSPWMFISPIKLAQLVEASSACFTAEDNKNILYLTMFLLKTIPTVCTVVSLWTTMAWFVCLYFVTWCTGRCPLNCTVIGSGEKSWHQKKKKKSYITNCMFFINEWFSSPDVTTAPNTSSAPSRHIKTLSRCKAS